jgi:mannose-6-phosphate isomerase-like protein (cupin superfamily)
VQKGTLQITSGDSEQTLQKGDSAQYRADVDHSIHNPGKTPAVFFLVDIYANSRM